MQTNTPNAKAEYVPPRVETLGDFGVATQHPQPTKISGRKWDGFWWYVGGLS
jgi:hypothetical protein